MNNINFNKDLILRIDSPVNGANLINNRVKFFAWVISQDKPTLEQFSLYVSDKQELPAEYYQNLLFVGEKFDLNSKADFISDLKINLREDQNCLIPEANIYTLEGTLDFSTIDKSKSLHKIIAISFTQNDSLTISNQVQIKLLSESEGQNVFGGFLDLPAKTILRDFHLFEGWIVKKEDELLSVELFFNQTSVGFADIQLLSPEQHLYFPDHKFSKQAKFALGLFKDAFVQKIHNFDFSKPFIISAKCKFKSAVEYTINGNSIYWPQATQSEIMGKIEAVKIIKDGLINIQGWLINRSFSATIFYLEGFNWRLKLLEGAHFSYTRNDEVADRFLLNSRGSFCNFNIILSPESLGNAPGIVKLVAENENLQRFEIGPTKLWDVISRYFYQSIAYQSKIKSVVAKVPVVLCKAGIRKKFTSPTIIRKKKSSLKKVLFVSHNFSAVEGATKVLLSIVKEYLKKHNEPSNVMVISTKEGELEESYQQLGVTTIVAKELFPDNLSWDNYHSAIQKYHAQISTFNPDFIYANVIDSFWAIDYARRQNIPNAWGIQESINPLNAFPTHDHRIREIFLYRLARCSKVIFAANETRNLYATFVNDLNSQIIKNSIDLEVIESIKTSTDTKQIRSDLGLKDEIVISIIGTTTERKGQDIFLREMKHLVDLEFGKKFKFYIVGARDLEFLHTLKELTTTLKLEDKVEFVVESADISKYYLASDYIAICSREESAPLVTLEAFAYEKPLISTSVFGLREQVKNEHNALTFDHLKSGDLAHKISTLLKNEGLRNKLLENAKADVMSNYNVTVNFPKYIEAISSVFNKFYGL
ncbi:MAG: glycosyltransferase family 4 protein [Proteobacteria bacterium]|nr:glycosyltransferase family 4 protein [Pseudomonadota bacterium]